MVDNVRRRRYLCVHESVVLQNVGVRRCKHTTPLPPWKMRHLGSRLNVHRYFIIIILLIRAKLGRVRRVGMCPTEPEDTGRHRCICHTEPEDTPVPQSLSWPGPECLAGAPLAPVQDEILTTLPIVVLSPISFILWSLDKIKDSSRKQKQNKQVLLLQFFLFLLLLYLCLLKKQICITSINLSGTFGIYICFYTFR